MTSSQRASTNEATKAVSLALLLDGRACGLTSSQIRESGALGSPQNSDAAFLKQFARARERLARVGIIIRNVAPTGEEARYVVDPGLSYAATNSIELTGEEAFQLTYLMTLCLQTNVPFKDDLRRARDELLSMMRPSATFPEPDMTEAPDKNSCQTRTSSDKPSPDNACAHREDESVLDIARDAYIRRKPLSFSYINAQGVRSERVVKVYGFFFYHARAYLVGLDGAHDEVRVFRTSRVEARPQPRVLVEEGSYVIPDDFDIHEHMGLPFHYGDDDFVAEFPRHAGPVRAGAGEPHQGARLVARGPVRRAGALERQGAQHGGHGRMGDESRVGLRAYAPGPARAEGHHRQGTTQGG